jgi:hypothetical protein
MGQKMIEENLRAAKEKLSDSTQEKPAGDR